MQLHSHAQLELPQDGEYCQEQHCATVFERTWRYARPSTLPRLTQKRIHNTNHMSLKSYSSSRDHTEFNRHLTQYPIASMFCIIIMVSHLSGMGLYGVSSVDEALRMNSASRASANIQSAPSSQDRYVSTEAQRLMRLIVRRMCTH